MKIYEEKFRLEEFECWGGAEYWYNKIIESGNSEEFMDDLEEIYPEGIEDMTLNDILWFDDEYCIRFVADELLDEEELRMKHEW